MLIFYYTRGGLPQKWKRDGDSSRTRPQNRPQGKAHRKPASVSALKSSHSCTAKNWGFKKKHNNINFLKSLFKIKCFKYLKDFCLFCKYLCIFVYCTVSNRRRGHRLSHRYTLFLKHTHTLLYCNILHPNEEEAAAAPTSRLLDSSLLLFLLVFFCFLLSVASSAEVVTLKERVREREAS